MSSHTPGKWGYEDPLGPDILTIVANPDAPVYDWIWVAQISTEIVEDDDGTVRDNRSFEEHEANARLIAAAPDLLAALKAMVLNDTHTYRDCHKAALAAISSASEPRP